jgi:nucleoside phosphorylase
MLDEEHEVLERDDNDENLYTLGSVAGHNVVIVCLPSGRIGNNPAAAVAMQMRWTFKKIKIGLMVGVGGGVPSAEEDIRLGDVVVSQPHQTFGGVVQFDAGKTTPNGFERIGSLNAPPQILLGAVAMVEADEERGRGKLTENVLKIGRNSRFQRNKAGADVLFKATYDHEGGLTCDKCNADRQEARQPRDSKEEVVVHYGTIASGNQIMENAAERDKISAKLGGVLCFEMEAAGLMNNFPCLVIRGICDYADSHKNKKWQRYAAATAAAYGKSLLSKIPPVDVAKHNGTVYDAIDGGAESAQVQQSDSNDALGNLARLTERLHVRAGSIGSPKQNTPSHKGVLEELDAGEVKWMKLMQSRWKNGRCLNCGSDMHWEYDCLDNCGKCTITVSIYEISVLLIIKLSGLYPGHKASDCRFPVRCVLCEFSLSCCSSSLTYCATRS